MLKKLRLRIIGTIMAMATLVFAVAFFVLCSTMWHTSSSAFTHELEEAVENGPTVSVDFSIGGWNPRFDAMDDGESDDGSSTDDEGSRKRSPRGSFTPIALITFDPDEGTVLQYNADYAAMSQSVRATAIERTIEKANGSGIYTDLGLFWCIHSNKDGELVMAFADAGAFLSSMRATVMGILAVFALTLVAVTFVSILLAHLITRPVKRAWDQQTQFIADASHELKTPLTVILADTDIIAAHPQTQVADQMKWVCGIKDEAKHMKGLVEELLFLARNDEGGTGAGTRDKQEPINLSALAQESCLAFDAVAFEANVELNEDIEDGVEIRADKIQVERLIRSLIDNAVKYAGTQGHVTVKLRKKKKDHAVFTVNNTGPVIPANELPHVFDRFWRSDTSRTRGATASYGLGLAIAKSIAQAQGADISVTSTEKDGTTFTVEF